VWDTGPVLADLVRPEQRPVKRIADAGGQGRLTGRKGFDEMAIEQAMMRLESRAVANQNETRLPALVRLDDEDIAAAIADLRGV
jgi:hypothetical protein